jgi:hypothetical protein
VLIARHSRSCFEKHDKKKLDSSVRWNDGKKADIRARTRSCAGCGDEGTASFAIDAVRVRSPHPTMVSSFPHASVGLSTAEQQVIQLRRMR